MTWNASSTRSIGVGKSIDNVLVIAAYLLRVLACIVSGLLCAEFAAASRRNGRLSRALVYCFGGLSISIAVFLIITAAPMQLDRQTLLKWSIVGWLPLNGGLWGLWWALRPPKGR